jgi:hypothetical protein
MGASSIEDDSQGPAAIRGALLYWRLLELCIATGFSFMLQWSP